MAGVYTDLTEKATHTINYSYVCQHCGEPSGVLSEELKATANKRKSGYKAKFSIDERMELHKTATERLQRHLDDRRKKVANGDYTAFYGRCPHCNKSQKWSVGSFGKDVITTALGMTFLVAFFGLGAAIVVFAVLEAFVTAEVIFTIYGVVVAISCVASFVLAFKNWSDNRRDTKGITDNSVPEIQWNL